jgi:hypothetical protein
VSYASCQNAWRRGAHIGAGQLRMWECLQHVNDRHGRERSDYKTLIQFELHHKSRFLTANTIPWSIRWYTRL